MGKTNCAARKSVVSNDYFPSPATLNNNVKYQICGFNDNLSIKQRTFHSSTVNVSIQKRTKGNNRQIVTIAQIFKWRNCIDSIEFSQFPKSQFQNHPLNAQSCCASGPHCCQNSGQYKKYPVGRDRKRKKSHSPRLSALQGRAICAWLAYFSNLVSSFFQSVHIILFNLKYANKFLP